MNTLNIILSVILLYSSNALATEARWITGTLASRAGEEPLLYVEYEEPQGGLTGEYFYLLPAEGLEQSLTEAIQQTKRSLTVFVEYTPDYEGQYMKNRNGFLFEAKVLKIADLQPAPKPIDTCARNLYEIFQIPPDQRPGKKKRRR